MPMPRLGSIQFAPNSLILTSCIFKCSIKACLKILPQKCQNNLSLLIQLCNQGARMSLDCVLRVKTQAYERSCDKQRMGPHCPLSLAKCPLTLTVHFLSPKQPVVGLTAFLLCSLKCLFLASNEALLYINL